MDIPKMNLLFIIVVFLQICLNVKSQPGSDPSWGPSPALSPGPSRGPTQGTSGDPFWGSHQRPTGSSSWGPPQISTRGLARPSQGTCNCGLYDTCAMVRHGNAPPQMACINATETFMLRQALQRHSNMGGQGRRPGRQIRRLSPGRLRAPRWREPFPRQQQGRTSTEFGIDLPNMRLLNTNDLTRTRSSEASVSNGQRSRTFRGHRGSGTGSFVQLPDVKFMSRRQGNVRNTPRSGHNSVVQSGIDLASQRDIANNSTRPSIRRRQSAVGIQVRHVTDSIKRINRYLTPPTRQRHTTTRQVQRRRNDVSLQSRL